MEKIAPASIKEQNTWVEIGKTIQKTLFNWNIV